jgi:putative transposase
VVRDERALIIRLRDLAFARVRFGYRRLTVLLQREGWQVGCRRVHRLYQAEGLMVRSQLRKKRDLVPVAGASATATAANQRWAMDFVTKRLENGRYFRILTRIGQFTRECLLSWADS